MVQTVQELIDASLDSVVQEPSFVRRISDSAEGTFAEHAQQIATAIVTQASSIPRLDIPAIADIDVQAGVRAYRQGNYPSGLTIDVNVNGIITGRCSVAS